MSPSLAIARPTVRRSTASANWSRRRMDGQHLTYVVSGTPVAVSPNDVNVLNYFGDNRITLTTCTPEFSAAQRLIVVGELEQHVKAPKTPAKHISYHIVNPATASWDWPLLPAVGIEV
jgi:hypothetical protein